MADQAAKSKNYGCPKKAFIPNDIKVLGSAGAHIAAEIRKHCHKINSGGYRKGE